MNVLIRIVTVVTTHQYNESFKWNALKCNINKIITIKSAYYDAHSNITSRFYHFLPTLIKWFHCIWEALICFFIVPITFRLIETYSEWNVCLIISGCCTSHSNLCLRTSSGYYWVPLKVETEVSAEIIDVSIITRHKLMR